MTVEEILTYLQAKLVQLNALRGAAARIGDIDQLMKFDADINKTTTTVDQLKTLIN